MSLVTTTQHQVEKRSWYLGSPMNPGFTINGTLDVSAFEPNLHFPDGYIQSGEPLAEISAGLYGPYFAADNEVAVITRTATGGTVDISLDGEVNEGVSIVAATTAAEVLGYIEALSNVDAGDVTVTGSAGGPFTVTFVGGAYEGVDTPNLEIDDTDATGGTVTVEITDGGDGTAADVCVGLLFSSAAVNPLDTTQDVPVAILTAFAPVLESKLPRPLDAGARADLKNIYFVPEA